MAAKLLCCPKCKKPFSYRVARAKWVKLLLFFLPIRRYFCSACFAKRYVLYMNTARFQNMLESK